jgi:sugar O-acyltransferase (sialic acid O-acetyltransferase NeuD family)
MKSRIILIGGGGHCKSCIDVIESTNQYDIVGIIDLKEKVGTTILGYPIIGSDEQTLTFLNEVDYFIITMGQIGLPKRRKEIYMELKNKKVKFATIISPLAYVSKHAKIGEGTIIMHQAVVNAAVEIGENCIINTKALIEHDAKIENHCHVSTGGIINGGAKLGEDSFFGSGAVSKEYITIDKKSFIKANSIVK